MTRKHYNQIASDIRDIIDGVWRNDDYSFDQKQIAENAIERVVSKICNLFDCDNPNFDRTKFYHECGL